MAGSQEIIREYLVSLGYTVNKTEQREFNDGLEKTGKTVAWVGKGLLAVGAAIIGAATSFATSMDRLFYASQKAASSAANLKAFEYAGRQVGMTAEAVDAMVGKLAMTLRTDPGMKGWVESLGVDASDARQGADIWLDIMGKLHDMPFYQGSQFAEMIGMDPDSFFQIETNFDRFQSAIKERKRMAAGAGLDQDAAALAGRNLANAGGKASEMAGILTDLAAVKVAEKLDGAGDKLGRAGDAMLKAFGVSDVAGLGSKVAKGASGIWDWFTHPMSMGQPTNAARPLGQGKTQEEDTFDFLERAFGLSPGSLDHIWKKESNRSDPRFMVSKAGAVGPMGLMKGTADDLGVTDRMDFNQSAYGAAKYLAEQKKRFGSDELAMQAYNWGPGNMQRYLGAQAQGKNPGMPKETQDYPKGFVVGAPITININGVQVPVEVAKAVRRSLDDAADTQRYMPGSVR